MGIAESPDVAFDNASMEYDALPERVDLSAKVGEIFAENKVLLARVVGQGASGIYVGEFGISDALDEKTALMHLKRTVAMGDLAYARVHRRTPPYEIQMIGLS
jgi:hypothetical protein